MTLRTGAIALPLLLGVLAALPASAQDAAPSDAARAQAREHFTAGVAHYEAGRHEQALAEFQEAYRIAPHPMVRVNMANCYEQLGRPLEALHHFERFMAEAESASPQQRSDVEAAIGRLEGQLGEVRLSVAPDGASVVIDGAETRRAPILEPVRLAAGRHTIEVRMNGYRTASRELTVIGGQSERVSVQLERGADPVTQPVATTTAEPDPLSDPADDSPRVDADGDAHAASIVEMPPSDDGGGWELRLTMPVVIAAAVTGAFLVTTIVTGAAAFVANDEFEAAVARYEDPAASRTDRLQAQQDGNAAADRANNLSIASDVFLIATIAAAGATVFFVIVEGMDGGDDAQAGLRVAPFASPQAGGATLVGRF